MPYSWKCLPYQFFGDCPREVALCGNKENFAIRRMHFELFVIIVQFLKGRLAIDGIDEQRCITAFEIHAQNRTISFLPCSIEVPETSFVSNNKSTVDHCGYCASIAITAVTVSGEKFCLACCSHAQNDDLE